METLGNIVLFILFVYVVLRLIELYNYEERYHDFDLRLTSCNIKSICHNCLVYSSKKINSIISRIKGN